MEIKETKVLVQQFCKEGLHYLVFSGLWSFYVSIVSTLEALRFGLTMVCTSPHFNHFE